LSVGKHCSSELITGLLSNYGSLNF
jgi:hypothetical protein